MLFLHSITHRGSRGVKVRETRPRASAKEIVLGVGRSGQTRARCRRGNTSSSEEKVAAVGGHPAAAATAAAVRSSSSGTDQCPVRLGQYLRLDETLEMFELGHLQTCPNDGLLPPLGPEAGCPGRVDPTQDVRGIEVHIFVLLLSGHGRSCGRRIVLAWNVDCNLNDGNGNGIAPLSLWLASFVVVIVVIIAIWRPASASSSFRFRDPSSGWATANATSPAMALSWAWGTKVIDAFSAEATNYAFKSRRRRRKKKEWGTEKEKNENKSVGDSFLPLLPFLPSFLFLVFI